MTLNHKKAYTTPNVEIVLVQVDSPIASSNIFDLDDYSEGDQDDLF